MRTSCFVSRYEYSQEEISFETVGFTPASDAIYYSVHPDKFLNFSLQVLGVGGIQGPLLRVLENQITVSLAYPRVHVFLLGLLDF